SRQIPPKLIFLSEQQGELAAIPVITFPGHIPKHAGRAGGWIEQPSEHFQRRSLARAVGSEESDQFSRLDVKTDILHRQGLFVLPVEQASNCAAEARLLLVRAKCFGQTVNF